MHRKIHLAWAVAVDEAQPAARLEAYVETKAAITTFRLSVPRGVSLAMSSLPPEVLTMIADNVRDLVYQGKIRGWVFGRNRARKSCDPKDHFTRGELSDIYYENGSFPKHKLSYTPGDCGWERHDENVENYPEAITLPARSEAAERLARCKEVNYASTREDA